MHQPSVSPPPARPRRRVLWISQVAIYLSLFLLLEAGVRMAGRADSDGNFYLGWRRLQPYRVPVRAVASVLAQANTVRTPIAYDPDLGWTNRPDSRSRDGLKIHDGDGLRNSDTAVHHSSEAPPGTRRIAIFGDSFTYGDQVAFGDTWGAELERRLGASGLRTEVLNYGVTGYGIDQAYLRWRKEGRQFKPDLVILGLMPDDIGRNLSLVKPLYLARSIVVSDPGIPYSKPRFVFDADALRLINSPTVPPERLPAMLADYERWEYSRFDAYYDPDDYRQTIWGHSRFVAWLVDVSQRNRWQSTEDEDPDPATGDEAMRLSRSILARFKHEVEESGSRFAVVYLPGGVHLAWALAGDTVPEASLLRDLRSDEHDLIDLVPALSKGANGNIRRLYSGNARGGYGHYSALGNRVVAAAIQEHVTPLLRADRALTRPPRASHTTPTGTAQ